MTVTDLKKYIHDNDKIPDILEDLECDNIKYHKDKDYYSATQPDGDNPMGVVVSNNNYLNYMSFSRSVSFKDRKDLISFIQECRGTDFVSTLRYLHKLLGLEFTLKYKKKQVKENQKEKVLSIFTKYKTYDRSVDLKEIDKINNKQLWDMVPTIHIDLFREGIIKKTIDKFGLMYSYKYHRTIFPMRYWADGSTIGLNGRTSIADYEDLGIRKYYLSKGYAKSYNLYGLWENRKDIEKAGYVVIFESEKSVLKRDSRNDSTAVALSGHTISEEQFRIILGLNIREVVIALDKDINRYVVYDICERFYGKRQVSFLSDYKGNLKSKDAPADATNEYYKYMFDNRVTYDSNLHKEYLDYINGNKR